jgi:hypothetical protein
MAAPIGNRFWEKRAKHGRDRAFNSPEHLWESACEYFSWCEDNPLMEATFQKYKTSRDSEKVEQMDLPKMRAFTMGGLCIYLGVNQTYFNKFESENKGRKDQKSIDFCQIITRIREIIYEQKFTGAASGFFNSNIIARDLGLTDKREIEEVKIKVTKKK